MQTAPPSNTITNTGDPNASLRRTQRIRNLIYAGRIVGQGLFTLFLVSSFTFFLIRLMPGNPVDIKIQQLINAQSITYDEAARIASQLYDFDPSQPVLQQYTQYLGKLIQLDLGKSITSGASVVSQIVQFLPYTLFSVGLGLLVSFSLGTLLGMAMAYWREGLLDNIITFFASIIYGIPDYIIALFIILVFGVQLGLFRQSDILGAYDPKLTPGFTPEFIASLFQRVSLPVLVYVLTTIGGWILTMKSSTINTLGEDYITVANARGLKQRRILLGYVGRNAMLPQVTRLAISVGFVLGGSVIIETLFAYPGLGRLLINSIIGRDYTTMQGVFLTIAASVIIANIMADLLYGVLDPRVRVGRGNSR
jgi:peptide/nickel transport system permease protein